MQTKQKSGIFSTKIAIYDYFWNEKTKNHSSQIVSPAYTLSLCHWTTKIIELGVENANTNAKKWDFQSKNSHFYHFCASKISKLIFLNSFLSFHTTFGGIKKWKLLKYRTKMINWQKIAFSVHIWAFLTNLEGGSIFSEIHLVLVQLSYNF